MKLGNVHQRLSVSVEEICKWHKKNFSVSKLKCNKLNSLLIYIILWKKRFQRKWTKTKICLMHKQKRKLSRLSRTNKWIENFGYVRKSKKRRKLKKLKWNFKCSRLRLKIKDRWILLNVKIVLGHRLKKNYDERPMSKQCTNKKWLEWNVRNSNW